MTNESVTIDHLARTAQTYLAERPVVVLGTGATIPHGLPSMAELAHRLQTEIQESPPGWDIFAKRLSETADIEQTLHEIALPKQTVELLVRTTWQIVASKDLEFHAAISERRASFPLAELFRYLLRTAESHLRVVTTNYDRVAEYASNYVHAYASTGLTAGWLQRFAAEVVNEERRPTPGFEGQVTILKVHGSLDWFRGEEKDIVGIPLARSIPPNLRPLVVTPGMSKYREVHKDPFRTVMSTADAVLRNATCFLCVGYGFNDEHVQPILISRVQKEDVPLVLVTKTITKQARTAFLGRPPKKFLFLEEEAMGSRAYAPECPSGAVIEKKSIWTLNGFMELVRGQ